MVREFLLCKPLAPLGVASDGSSLTRKFANFDSNSGEKFVY